MIVVTTEKFIGLGKLETDALGIPDLHFEIIPHPLGGLPPEIAEGRGQELGAAIKRYLESEAEE